MARKNYSLESQSYSENSRWGKEGGKKRDCPLVHSLKSCNSQGWTMLKPETYDSIQLSKVAGKGPNTWQAEVVALSLL